MEPRRRRTPRDLAGPLTWGSVSVAVHLLAVLALLQVRASPPISEPEIMTVALVDLPPPPPPAEIIRPTPPAPSPPTPEKPPPPRIKARLAKAPAPPDVAPLPADDRESGDGEAEISDAQVASAATVGSGPPGGACNMQHRLQAALRKDRRVLAAATVAAQSGRPLFVWNGDWVRSHGQDGAGLAAVRESIMWEVAFAPAQCRTEAVSGLVLVSLADRPGAPRLVLGSGAWRWSDLLHPKRRN